MSDNLSPAQKAWVTRRAIAAARVAVKGIEEASPLAEARVVDLYLDEPKVGCGQRRYIVLGIGPKWVRLYYYSKLTTITVDRRTFDARAKVARDSKPRKLIAIIKRNLAEAKEHGWPTSTKVASEALAILKS